MLHFTIEIDGTDYTKYTPFPVKWESLLDERLDEGRLSMKRMPVETFAPCSEVLLKTWDDNKYEIIKEFVIATDASAETPPGSGWYNHEITLVERTKLLEGIVSDTLTFTNSLGRNFLKNQIPVSPYTGDSDFQPDAIPGYITPLGVGDVFIFKKVTDIYRNPPISYPRKGTMRVYRNDTEVFVNYYGEGGSFPDSPAAEEYTVELSSGVWTVVYELSGYVDPGDPQSEQKAKSTYTFAVSNQSPLPEWNIRQVIERVLDVAETHLASEQPRYKLNAEQAAGFETITAPEFRFTNNTLKEILDQIGGFIHGIPRLEGDTIYYDMLGGTELSGIAEQSYCSNITTQNIETYATRLDSTVDNFVNILNKDEGELVEPYDGGYRTVRTDTLYARIEEGNLCITTDLPIQELIKLECGYVNDNTKGGDLTGYVYEAADYARLSSYDETYPTSRAYALYYTQGQPNINGLMFKVPDATGGAFKNYTIANIIEKSCGVNIGAWNTDTSPYQRLAFSVTYVPVFGARVGQHKTYIGDFKQPRALVYNQAANAVETRYYGANLKGTIARMGNVDKMYNYTFMTLEHIPEVGQLFNEDYYISSVAAEIMPAFCKVTLGLSKDFNRLSQYIGMNSTKRFYEVSEKQSYKRNIIYTDYCVIGDKVERDKTLAEIGAMIAIDQTFKQNVVVGLENALSAAIVSGAVGDTKLNTALLPVVSTAIGNAMSFTMNYKDNYSAGDYATYSLNNSVKGYFANSWPYADYYGRIDNLFFDLHPSYTKPSSQPEQTLLGMAMPKLGDVRLPSPYIGTNSDSYPLRVRKDGSEQLAMNYQLEFVTNRPQLIVGSALASRCSLVQGYSGTAYCARLYVFDRRLPKFDVKVDLSGATSIRQYTDTSTDIHIDSNGSLVFEPQTSTVDGRSYAIVRPIYSSSGDITNYGELLFGENTPIKSGEAINLPTMTFRHNIYNL